MRCLLDTSVLLGPDPGEIEGEIAISSASLAELHFSVLVARSDATRASRLRRLAIIEQTFQALPIDTTVAREYGRLAAAVVAAGRQPRARAMDLLIAATASAHGARLYTRNP
ncbi:MAG: PIN domain-containing protein, partial [Propionibacteriales bacterium]|nr:PIN domain-containing protein [Propionibacteriales bacterium]